MFGAGRPRRRRIAGGRARAGLAGRLRRAGALGHPRGRLRAPAGPAEDDPELVPPGRGELEVVPDGDVLVEVDPDGVERVNVLGQPVTHALALALEGPEHAVPEDQLTAVVAG